MMINDTSGVSVEKKDIEKKVNMESNDKIQVSTDDNSNKNRLNTRLEFKPSMTFEPATTTATVSASTSAAAVHTETSALVEMVPTTTADTSTLVPKMKNKKSEKQHKRGNSFQNISLDSIKEFVPSSSTKLSTDSVGTNIDIGNTDLSARPDNQLSIIRSDGIKKIDNENVYEADIPVLDLELMKSYQDEYNRRIRSFAIDFILKQTSKRENWASRESYTDLVMQYSQFYQSIQTGSDYLLNPYLDDPSLYLHPVPSTRSRKAHSSNQPAPEQEVGRIVELDQEDDCAEENTNDEIKDDSEEPDEIKVDSIVDEKQEDSMEEGGNEVDDDELDKDVANLSETEIETKTENDQDSISEFKIDPETWSEFDPDGYNGHWKFTENPIQENIQPCVSCAFESSYLSSLIMDPSLSRIDTVLCVECKQRLEPYRLAEETFRDDEYEDEGEEDFRQSDPNLLDVMEVSKTKQSVTTKSLADLSECLTDPHTAVKMSFGEKIQRFYVEHVVHSSAVAAADEAADAAAAAAALAEAKAAISKDMKKGDENEDACKDDDSVAINSDITNEIKKKRENKGPNGSYCESDVDGYESVKSVFNLPKEGSLTTGTTVTDEFSASLSDLSDDDIILPKITIATSDCGSDIDLEEIILGQEDFHPGLPPNFKNMTLDEIYRLNSNVDGTGLKSGILKGHADPYAPFLSASRGLRKKRSKGGNVVLDKYATLSFLDL